MISVITSGAVLASMLATPVFASENGSKKVERMENRVEKQAEIARNQQERWSRLFKKNHVDDACRGLARATNAVGIADAQKAYAASVQTAAQAFLTSVKSATDDASVTAAKKAYQTAMRTAQTTLTQAKRAEAKKQSDALKLCVKPLVTTATSTVSGS